MSKKAAAPAKAAPVKAAKTEKKASPAKAAKGAPAEAPAEVQAAGEASETAVDLEELEEQQEEARASSGGGNAAALAAANGTTEISASFKNFRHHPDMENFYRFIFENDLRHEALAIIDQITIEKQTRKTVKLAKAQPH